MKSMFKLTLAGLLVVAPLAYGMENAAEVANMVAAPVVTEVVKTVAAPVATEAAKTVVAEVAKPGFWMSLGSKAGSLAKASFSYVADSSVGVFAKNNPKTAIALSVVGTYGAFKGAQLGCQGVKAGYDWAKSKLTKSEAKTEDKKEEAPKADETKTEEAKADAVVVPTEAPKTDEVKAVEHCKIVSGLISAKDAVVGKALVVGSHVADHKLAYGLGALGVATVATVAAVPTSRNFVVAQAVKGYNFVSPYVVSASKVAWNNIASHPYIYGGGTLAAATTGTVLLVKHLRKPAATEVQTSVEAQGAAVVETPSKPVSPYVDPSVRRAQDALNAVKVVKVQHADVNAALVGFVEACKSDKAAKLLKKVKTNRTQITNFITEWTQVSRFADDVSEETMNALEAACKAVCAAMNNLDLAGASELASTGAAVDAAIAKVEAFITK